jgi:hypothetical protein
MQNETPPNPGGVFVWAKLKSVFIDLDQGRHGSFPLRSHHHQAKREFFP